MKNKVDVSEGHMDEGLMDEGYPTQQFLDMISTWPYENTVDLFKTLHSVWQHRYLTFWTESVKDHTNDDVVHLHISTLGWSGNEDMMRALKDNYIVWGIHWYSHIRGGHYVFEFSEQEEMNAVLEAFNKYID